MLSLSGVGGFLFLWLNTGALALLLNPLSSPLLLLLCVLVIPLLFLPADLGGEPLNRWFAPPNMCPAAAAEEEEADTVAAADAEVGLFPRALSPSEAISSTVAFVLKV